MKRSLYLPLLFFLGTTLTHAQNEGFNCQNSNYYFLKKALGTWEVKTKDRTSPGVYENNSGRATITNAIAGCGISISFRGTFKSKPYAREIIITGLDSNAVQMVTMDSEHGSFSMLEGTETEGKMELLWYRDKEKKRLQSKYIMTFEGSDAFEFSSFLSTDYGKTWALTHERKYIRAGSSIANSEAETASIQGILDAYYDCISGPIGQTRDFGRLRNLFHPEARLIYSYWNADNTKANTLIFKTTEEFIEKLDYLDKKGFYEHEISNKIHSFGSVTQVFSTYTFRAEDNSIPAGRGITSYELFYDGQRYWIMSMFWMAENSRFSIPDVYLRKE